MLDPQEMDAIRRRIIELKTEHRDLDTVINDMHNNVAVDQLRLRRMKKRKLAIKDSIKRLESRLIPDLDA